MKQHRFTQLRQSVLMMALSAPLLMSGQAQALETQAYYDQMVDAMVAQGGCPEDIAKEIANNNKKLIDELVVTTDKYIGVPKASTDDDCMSSLTKISYGFDFPGLMSVAKKAFNDAMEKYCKAAVSEANSLVSGAGLDFSQDLGGTIPLPGIDDSIDVDAGGGSVGTSGGFKTGGNGYTAPFNANGINTSGKTSSTTSTSGTSYSGEIETGGSSGDFLDNIFN